MIDFTSVSIDLESAYNAAYELYSSAQSMDDEGDIENAETAMESINNVSHEIEQAQKRYNEVHDIMDNLECAVRNDDLGEALDYVKALRTLILE